MRGDVPVCRERFGGGSKGPKICLRVQGDAPNLVKEWDRTLRLNLGVWGSWVDRNRHADTA